MASLTEIADAITAEINDGSRSWSGTLTATRMNVPIVKREDVATISVVVTPISRTTTKRQRGLTEDLCRFQVGIQKGLTVGGNAETDPLVAIGESIQAYFDKGLPLEAMPQTSCEATSFGTNDESPWLSVRNVDDLMLYTGVIELTFRVIRAVA